MKFNAFKTSRKVNHRNGRNNLDYNIFNDHYLIKSSRTANILKYNQAQLDKAKSNYEICFENQFSSKDIPSQYITQRTNPKKIELNPKSNINNKYNFTSNRKQFDAFSRNPLNDLKNANSIQLIKKRNCFAKQIRGKLLAQLLKESKMGNNSYFHIKDLNQYPFELNEHLFHPNLHPIIRKKNHFKFDCNNSLKIFRIKILIQERYNQLIRSLSKKNLRQI